MYVYLARHHQRRAPKELVLGVGESIDAAIQLTEEFASPDRRPIEWARGDEHKPTTGQWSGKGWFTVIGYPLRKVEPARTEEPA